MLRLPHASPAALVDSFTLFDCVAAAEEHFARSPSAAVVTKNQHRIHWVSTPATFAAVAGLTSFNIHTQLFSDDADGLMMVVPMIMPMMPSEICKMKKHLFR
jgi:hypothetical protein